MQLLEVRQRLAKLPLQLVGALLRVARGGLLVARLVVLRGLHVAHRRGEPLTLLRREARPSLPHRLHARLRQLRAAAIPLESVERALHAGRLQLRHPLHQLTRERRLLRAPLEQALAAQQRLLERRITLLCRRARRALEGRARLLAVGRLAPRRRTLHLAIERLQVALRERALHSGLARQRLGRRVPRAPLIGGLAVPRALELLSQRLRARQRLALLDALLEVAGERVRRARSLGELALLRRIAAQLRQPLDAPERVDLIGAHEVRARRPPRRARAGHEHRGRPGRRRERQHEPLAPHDHRPHIARPRGTQRRLCLRERARRRAALRSRELPRGDDRLLRAEPSVDEEHDLGVERTTPPREHGAEQRAERERSEQRRARQAGHAQRGDQREGPRDEPDGERRPHDRPREERTPHDRDQLIQLLHAAITHSSERSRGRIASPDGRSALWAPTARPLSLRHPQRRTGA